jgi:hypothetical protein
LFDWIKNISLRQLAGISRILGVDVSEDRARVVEVQERWLNFRRRKERFAVRSCFTVEFDPQSTWPQKAELLRQKLAEHGIKTGYAVSSIHSLGVKVIDAAIPPDVRSVDEWISENRERLLRIPLASGHIDHAVEELERTESGIRAEISFVRREEIERWKSFFRGAGLELIALGAGFRDASNVLVLVKIPDDVSIKFAYSHDGPMDVVGIAQARIRSHQTAVPPEQIKQDDSLLFISGEKTQQLDLPGAQLLRPLGLPLEYCLAVGLALKGLRQNLSPANLLSSEETKHIETQLYKSLFQRTVIGTGAVTVVLLLLPFVAGLYLNWRSNSIDEQLLANGGSYTELKLLETQTLGLEKQLSGSSTTVRSSETARVLHDIAAASSEGLWLYRVKLETGNRRESKVSLFGYTSNNEKVTDYLKSLGLSGYEASLVRSGSPQPNETAIPSRKGIGTFEILVNIKK